MTPERIIELACELADTPMTEVDCERIITLAVREALSEALYECNPVSGEQDDITMATIDRIKARIRALKP